MELTINEIKNKIYIIRGLHVMVDRDLAKLYKVENRILNQAVKRNITRFPSEFMFQLTKEEFEYWKSQIEISNSDKMGLRKLPYVFTEQGVSMLSAVLKSDTAIKTSIEIINSFVKMRKYMLSNNLLEQRFNQLEQKLLVHEDKFEKVFKAIESKHIKPTQGIFYDGQVFDAYNFVSNLIREAKQSIILMDNYVDDTTLTIFSKVPNIKVTIYTHTITKQLRLDLKKYNTQYTNITIKTFKNSHDRFLIIDEKELYHIGASLKDLGKKWFAFSKMDMKSVNILDKLI